MSRGFVKEEDQEEAPFIPPRAALPVQEINYVTPVGLALLKQEKQALEKERIENTQENETERRRHNMLLDGKLRLLDERLNSARVLDPATQPKTEVRFGATVNFNNLTGPLKGKKMRLQIVGVDEADVRKQKISFLSPLAQTSMGKQVGDTVELLLGKETRELTVLEIQYEA